MPGSSVDVVVVGGGPAGLAAALLAARAGCSVQLLEASPRLGGMAASPTVAGQRVDLGSHRLHPSISGSSRALVHQLLGPDLQVRPRRGRLRLGERWVGFPLQVGDVVRSLPPTTAARIGIDLLRAGRGGKAVESYADVVAARLGRSVLDRFHGPYAQKLWGVPPEQLSADLARRRIALRGARDVVARLRRSRTAEGRTFLYPRLGYGQIVDRLEAEAHAAGVDVRTSTAPTAVVAGSPPVVHTEAAAVTAGRVLWTAPPTALAEAAGLAPPPLIHRAVALVYLVVAADQYLPWDAHYIPDPDVPFVRLSEPKNYRDGPDPSGQTVLCAEVPCAVADERWEAPVQSLAMQVQRGMGRLGLPMAPVVDADVIRLPRVYPLIRAGEEEPLRVALEAVETLEGVTVLGRQGLAVADNLHHVLDMAAAAVACLGPDGAWSEAAWRAARRRFDAHVIED